MQLTLLNPLTPEQPFPASHAALNEPNGLLAVGGCLSAPRLINAYKQGIFPWFNSDDPILWWTPDPRLVLVPQEAHITRSLKKTLSKGIFNVTFDRCFTEVIRACARPRNHSDGTWISTDIVSAYQNLHAMGLAHSIETWYQGKLVGGLYGVTLGQVFFGESMFHTQTDASKVAFAHLVNWLQDWQYNLIDCQVHSPHLASLGAHTIPRVQFVNLLQQLTAQPPHLHAWKLSA